MRDAPSGEKRMHRMPILPFVMAAFYALPVAAFDGDVDPSFGTDGQVALIRPTDQNGNGTRPTGDVSVLADGRFLWVAPLDDGSVWLGRMHRNGTPDLFGLDPGGRITIPACGPASRNAMLVADDDGGAVVWASNCLVRVLADGSIDATFAGGALPPQGFRAAGFARDTAGRYVLAGKEGLQLALYRFTAQGLPDETFGTAGRVTVVVPSTNGFDDLYALALRPDDRILVGGSRGNTHGPNLVIAQYTPDGTLDPSWDGDGIVDIPPPDGHDRLYVTAMALDSDGSLVVSGIGSTGSTTCCRMLSRFDAGGQMVPSFGLRIFTIEGNASLFPFFEQRDGLVVLPDHRILAGAISFPFAAPFTHRTQYTLIRTFADGTLDPGFGHGGWNSYTIADPEDAGQTGDYDQMHAIGYDRADDSLLILGRTFFEDNSTGHDYVTMVRARFDLIFADAFER
jgi:uncharacterized delta-60 repeat protein